MFPLLALTGFLGYQMAKNKYDKDNTPTITNTNTTKTDDESVAKKQNIYNYYTSESDNGNVLFNQQKRKRNLFGSEQLV